MATKPDRWYFSREQLKNSPSAKCGIESEKELSYRQQAANLIQDMGQRLQVFQLCINTAIVYMHRFYMFHSFTKFPRNSISAACLFLAAKVEEQPHKLEHVIRVAHACLHRGEPPLDPRSNAYAQQAQELVINESIILQTLGFEVGVVHPHTHVVKCTQMIRASKDLSQSSYFLATNSLHLTTFCLKYKPTVVACVCIHLACKWTQWTIPKSNDGKGWWEYVDPTVKEEHLDELTREFLYIIDRCPARLKKRIMGYNKNANTAKDAKRPRTEGQSSTDSSQQAGTSTQVDSKASTSSSVYDFSFDSKPATGFDQYSDSEDSKSEEPASQKSDKISQKPEKVRVTIEEYKRKEKERREKDMLSKQQQFSSGGDKPEIGGLGGSRALSKDLVKQGPKLLPGNIENIISSKERVPHGLEKLSSGQERVHPSHDRSHTGHDRISHNHDKRHSSHDKHLPGSKRTVLPHDKMHSGHTRGPSGPERLSSSERNSGLEKSLSNHGRDPTRPLMQDQTHSNLGVRPHDKTAASALGMVKQSESLKKIEQRRPDLHVPASAGSGKEATPLPTERTLPGNSRDLMRKEHGQRSYAQAVKAEKIEKDHSMHRSEQLHNLHANKSEKHRKPEPSKESLHVPKGDPEPEHATQETLDLFTQISEEIMKDIEKETTNPPDPLLTSPVSVPEITRKEPRIAEDLLKDKLQSPSSVPSSVKPDEKGPRESESEEPIADVISPFDAILEEGKDHHDSKRERREDRERRREGHKSKKDDKRHKSHKHRHRSPGSSHKHRYENDIGEGSGDMAPPKKQRLEQTGSPHTVLTTSQGIKLKIKNLGNSFNNGSDHGKDTEKMANANCDSPGSVSLKLNLSKLSSSPREPGKERDSNHHHHHHHRSHHKHKSRHHRSKDGHRKHSHSPGRSSASDASPAISPSKRRHVETHEATPPSLHNQSLLDLPMPPNISKTSSRHDSSITKHGKRKRESNPPLPNEDVPPPPPPPQSNYMLSTGSGLQPMHFPTIDASAIYENFQPPLPSGRPRDQRPPPPPPIPPPQRRPPLPP